MRCFSHLLLPIGSFLNRKPPVWIFPLPMYVMQRSRQRADVKNYVHVYGGPSAGIISEMYETISLIPDIKVADLFCGKQKLLEVYTVTSRRKHLMLGAGGITADNDTAVVNVLWPGTARERMRMLLDRSGGFKEL